MYLQTIHLLLNVIVFYFHLKVVSKILPFRKENQKFLDPIWNKHHIERIEIVLKETLDAKGDENFHACKMYMKINDRNSIYISVQSYSCN